jgi:hypothetical protein
VQSCDIYHAGGKNMGRFGNWDGGLTFMVGKGFGGECGFPFDFSATELRETLVRHNKK